LMLNANSLFLFMYALISDFNLEFIFSPATDLEK